MWPWGEFPTYCANPIQTNGIIQCVVDLIYLPTFLTRVKLQNLTIKQIKLVFLLTPFMWICDSRNAESLSVEASKVQGCCL